MDNECPVCGLRYEDFVGYAPTFAEAYVEMFQESQRYAERGDYSKPADRRAVLGRMFQHKQRAWEGHIDACEEAAHYARQLGVTQSELDRIAEIAAEYEIEMEEALELYLDGFE